MTKQSDAEKDPHIRAFIYQADSVVRQKLNMPWRDARDGQRLKIWPPEDTPGINKTDSTVVSTVLDSLPSWVYSLFGKRQRYAHIAADFQNGFIAQEISYDDQEGPYFQSSAGHTYVDIDGRTFRTPGSDKLHRVCWGL